MDQQVAIALFNAGCGAMQQRDFELAEALFRASIERDPSYIRSHMNLAWCLQNRGALYSSSAMDAIRVLRAEDPLMANYRALYKAVFALVLSHVEGDVAEFGTDTGRTSLVLAAACADLTVRSAAFFARTKTPVPKLHLFDSFQGMPDSSNSSVDQDSPSVQLGLLAPGTCAGLSEEGLQKLLWDNIPESREFAHTHKGWYSETIPQIPADQKFALIHVDCDLYSSTCDVLNGLFQRGMVSQGAQIFFDDWWCNRGAPELGEQRAWAEAVGRFGVRFSDRGDYSPRGRSFIVHSYTKPGERR